MAEPAAARPLSLAHKHELEVGSGISSGLIAQAGIFTATKPAELAALGFSPEQSALVPALAFPGWAIDGDTPISQIKPDAPRLIGEKLVKYETPAGARMRAYVHPAIRAQLGDPAVPLIITEGVKKALALIARGHCAIALYGVWNFAGANEHGGVVELPDWAGVAWKSRKLSRDVYIIFDSDIVDKEGVRRAAIRLAAMVKRKGAKPLPIRIPSPESGEKVGVDDFFVGGGTSDALFAAVDPGLLRLDMIRWDGRGITDLASEAMAALVRYNEPPRVFVRAGELVTVSEDETGQSHLSELREAQMRGILGRATGWYKLGGKGQMVETLCPHDIVEDTLSLGRWPDIPPILGVTRGPVLAGDSVMAERGYSAGAQMWLEADSVEPFQGGAADAVEWLRAEIFAGFPFKSDADFAHALCLTLQPVVRPAINGPTPIYLFGSPTQKTGKTLLAKTCLQLTQGGSIAALPMTRNEEETRKRVTAELCDGAPYLLFDNLTGNIASAVLSALVGNEVWNDRVLGQTRMVKPRIRQAIVATANNPVLDRDLMVRCVRIFLDAGVEHPGDRTFERDLPDFIAAYLPKIHGALCRIVNGWLIAGRPLSSAHVMGGFNKWSKVMGGLLETCGVRGFLGNVHELRDSSGTLELSWGGFMQRWSILGGELTVSALLPMFTEDDELAALLGDRGEQGQRMKLGALLQTRVGVVCAGHVIERSAARYGGAALYRIVPPAEHNAARAVEPGRAASRDARI